MILLLVSLDRTWLILSCRIWACLMASFVLTHSWIDILEMSSGARNLKPLLFNFYELVTYLNTRRVCFHYGNTFDAVVYHMSLSSTKQSFWKLFIQLCISCIMLLPWNVDIFNIFRMKIPRTQIDKISLTHVLKNNLGACKILRFCCRPDNVNILKRRSVITWSNENLRCTLISGEDEVLLPLDLPLQLSV